jgi:hypothetical protein
MGIRRCSEAESLPHFEAHWSSLLCPAENEETALARVKKNSLKRYFCLV